mmetsp:Transcript_137103/g.382341  ORF Transcript_137103/g.382341 Transcript_137103/m.382341 type:complete len:318 (+) Transcript_137103:333-1286(+)
MDCASCNTDPTLTLLEGAIPSGSSSLEMAVEGGPPLCGTGGSAAGGGVTNGGDGLVAMEEFVSGLLSCELLLLRGDMVGRLSVARASKAASGVAAAGLAMPGAADSSISRALANSAATGLMISSLPRRFSAWEPKSPPEASTGEGTPASGHGAALGPQGADHHGGQGRRSSGGAYHGGLWGESGVCPTFGQAVSVPKPRLWGHQGAESGHQGSAAVGSHARLPSLECCACASANVRGRCGGTSGTEVFSHLAQHLRQNHRPSHSSRPSQQRRPSSVQMCLQPSHSLSSILSGSTRTPCSTSRLQHLTYGGPRNGSAF